MKEIYFICAAYEEEPIGVVIGKAEAEAYCKKWSIPESRFMRLEPRSAIPLTECPWNEDNWKEALRKYGKEESK